MRKYFIYFCFSILAIVNLTFVIFWIYYLHLSDASSILSLKTIEMVFEGFKMDWKLTPWVFLGDVIFPFCMSILAVIIILILAQNKNTTSLAWYVVPHLPTLFSMVGGLIFYLFFSVISLVLLTLPLTIVTSFLVWNWRHELN